MNRLFIYWVLILCPVLCWFGCANPVVPQGGPKDVKPPSLIVAEPAYLSVNFKSKKITLSFDEWVVLKDVAKNFNVSPPLSKKPDVKLKGKSVNIVLPEPLKDSTTYNFFFGNMIVDLNEGNVYKGLSYTVSTGNYIDSLSVSGKIIGGFDLEPKKDFFVLGYIIDNIADSVPKDSIAMKLRPDFISRTDENGNFTLGFLPKKRIFLVGLGDSNGNYLYDNSSEDIAFIGEDILPEYTPFYYDTIKQNDSVIEKIVPRHGKHSFYTLRSFVYADSINKIVKSDDSKPMRLKFNLRYPCKNPEYEIVFAKKDKKDIDLSVIANKGNDTVMIWVNNYADSLWLGIKCSGNMIDTLKSVVKEFAVDRKQKTGVYEPNPSISCKDAFSYPFFKNIELDLSSPVKTIDTSICRFIAGSDTLKPVFRTRQNNPCKVDIIYKLSPANEYKVKIPDSAFVDVYGRFFKGFEGVIRARSEESYGNFELEVVNDTDNILIIQLLGDKGVVVREVIATDSQKIVFDKLSAGTYKLKVVFDLNENGIWDTGNYFRKRQPEPVIFYDKEVKVRGNWDISEKWVISMPKY